MKELDCVNNKCCPWCQTTFTADHDGWLGCSDHLRVWYYKAGSGDKGWEWAGIRVWLNQEKTCSMRILYGSLHEIEVFILHPNSSITGKIITLPTFDIFSVSHPDLVKKIKLLTVFL